MHVLFLDNTDTVEASVKKLGEHLIQISGTEVNLSGFHLLNDAGSVFGKYDGFKTLYKENDDSYILSNDGSVYIEPVEPEPEPTPEPTLDEVKEAKVAEMNTTQQTIIAQGVDVTLTDGKSHHFSLSDHDQLSLMGLQTQVIAGSDKIPWHTSDVETGCEYFTNSDMALITEKAMEFVTWHITYFINLRLYINSMLDRESVEAVYYGIYIPEEYQDDVMKDLYSKTGK